MIRESGERQFDSFNEYYREVGTKCKRIFRKYFPDQAATFQPCPVSKIRGSFETSQETLQSWFRVEYNGPRPAQTVRDALKTISIIRYIDDFLDDYVWQAIDLTSPADRQKYFAMLDELFAVGQQLDSNLTANSFDIFRVEAELTADPTQKNFDTNIERLFRAKAYDMLLIYCQLNQINPEDVREHVEGMGIADFARDFCAPAHGQEQKSTDFDLYKFIQINHINPNKLIEYIESVFQREEPAFFQQYKAGHSVEQMFGDDDANDAYTLIVHTLNVLKKIL